MAVQWHYRVMGQEAGPVSLSELKELVEAGFLTPDVLVRTGPDDDWLPAGRVPGLFDDAVLAAAEADQPAAPATSPSESAATGWYCQVMDKEFGPLSAAALRELARSGFLSPGVLVRKGVHDDWLPLSEVKGLFDDAPETGTGKELERPQAPSPSTSTPAADARAGGGWYCKVMGQETGPLAPGQIKELAASGF